MAKNHKSIKLLKRIRRILKMESLMPSTREIEALSERLYQLLVLLELKFKMRS
jgi:hypothetical protein